MPRLMNYAFRFMCVLVLVLLLHEAQAANYELGTPFPMTCVGILQLNAGEYRLTEDANHLNSGSDADAQCQSAVIAERSSKTPYPIPSKKEP
jgi:hypothetical protein